jgi:murein DD-endopeptidase MepM/ murein hydrolase activator NlpD
MKKVKIFFFTLIFFGLCCGIFSLCILPTFAQSIRNNFAAPLDKAKERITKKKFGQYITPKTSPVQPERFTGYHTGVDFEILPGELNKALKVRAVCAGRLILKKYASGYGGVAVQSCKEKNQDITVIYGHLKLSSITLKLNQSIKVGDNIGILGANKSIETNGERKHLHLGIHKGPTINIRGYANTKSELKNWLDPCQLQNICK